MAYLKELEIYEQLFYPKNKLNQKMSHNFKMWLFQLNKTPAFFYY